MASFPKSHKKALETLAKLLNQSNITWILTGSTNLVMQGIDIEIGDIDIQVDSNQIAQLNTILSIFIVKPVSFSEGERFRSKYGVFQIEGIQVEAIADLEVQKEGSWIKVTKADFASRKSMILSKETVYLMSLEEEYQGYLTLGRTEKAEKIKEFIENSKN